MSLTPHHRNAVIEQGLPEDHHIQLLIHTRLLEHGQHSHRVHGGDHAAEHEVLKQGDISEAKGLNLADEVEGEADAEGIGQGPQACPPQDGANVLKERPGGHEVTTLQDDGWQEIQEVDARIHDRRRFVVSAKNDGAHQNPNDDEETALRHEARQSVVKAEA